MKKFLLLLFTLLSIISFQPQKMDFVDASSKIYARVTTSNKYLYKSAIKNNDISNVWCKLENSYFVEILNDYNDEFYKVSYNSIIGYTTKDNLVKIIDSPNSPFPTNIKITIKENGGCYLRTSPISKTATNNIIKTIDKGTENLLFIGYINGDESIDLKGNLWYLIKYGNEIGYIYSDFAKDKITIYPNLEDVKLLNNNYESNLINPLSNKETLITVIIILIPSLIILIMLIIPKPKTKKLRTKNHTINEIDLTEVTDIYNDIDL